MAKRTSTKKAPICKKGDRILASGKYGTVTNTSYSSLMPYEITWENGRASYHKEADFQLYKFQILPPDPEPEDIEEEEAAQLDLNFSREQQWKVGDRISDLSEYVNTMLQVVHIQLGKEVIKSELKELDKDNHLLSVIKAWYPDLNSDQLEEIRLKVYNALPESKALSAVLESSEDEDFSWLNNLSKPVESSRAKEDSPEQLSLLTDSTGESQLKTTKTRSQSSAATSIIKSLPQISEISTQPPVNTMQLSADSHVLEPAEQATEKDSTIQNQPCLESSSAASAKPDPSSYCLSNLWDLSIEELELGLEDSRWLDIQASIRSSLDAINLERSIRGTESLSFPTLLSGRGRGCRDAGLVECEKWWKANVIQTIGLQLSAEAIAGLHGFPANWYRNISPPSLAQPDTQDDSPAESSEAKPSPSPKLESPSNGSNGCGQNFKLKVCPKGKKKCTFIPGTWEDLVGCQSCKNWFGLETPIGTSILEQFPELKPEPDITDSLEKPRIQASTECRWWVGDRLIGKNKVGTVTNSTDKEVQVRWVSDRGGICNELYPRRQLKYLSEFEYQEAVAVKAKESQQTGSLYQYTANRTGKDGIRREYPIVEERERRRDDDDDWYWGISFMEKENGKWKDRSASIPRPSLPLARAMMRAGFPVATTIEAAQLKFCWLDFRGSWAIGEVRPEACPRLCLISFEAHQVLIIPSSQWGELKAAARHQKQKVIGEAIAEGKPFSYIKEILNAQ